MDRGSQTCGTHSAVKQEKKGGKKLGEDRCICKSPCSLHYKELQNPERQKRMRAIYFLEGVPFIIVKTDKILALLLPPVWSLAKYRMSQTAVLK